MRKFNFLTVLVFTLFSLFSCKEKKERDPREEQIIKFADEEIKSAWYSDGMFEFIENARKHDYSTTNVDWHFNEAMPHKLMDSILRMKPDEKLNWVADNAMDGFQKINPNIKTIYQNKKDSLNKISKNATNPIRAANEIAEEAGYILNWDDLFKMPFTIKTKSIELMENLTLYTIRYPKASFLGFSRPDIGYIWTDGAVVNLSTCENASKEANAIGKNVDYEFESTTTQFIACIATQEAGHSYFNLHLKNQMTYRHSGGKNEGWGNLLSWLCKNDKFSFLEICRISAYGYHLRHNSQVVINKFDSYELLYMFQYMAWMDLLEEKELQKSWIQMEDHFNPKSLNLTFIEKEKILRWLIKNDIELEEIAEEMSWNTAKFYTMYPTLINELKNASNQPLGNQYTPKWMK